MWVGDGDMVREFEFEADVDRSDETLFSICEKEIAEEKRIELRAEDSGGCQRDITARCRSCV